MMDSFEARLSQAKAREEAAFFENAARRETCKDRGALKAALERGLFTSKARSKLLNRLLEVPSSDQISQSQGMAFKVWEIAASIIDEVLSKGDDAFSQFPLLAGTALLIAFKVLQIDEIEGQEPFQTTENFALFGIHTVLELMEKPYVKEQAEQVQKMELFIMSNISWRVQTITCSEVAVYYLRKFWMECLKKPAGNFPKEKLQGMIQEFVKRGQLLDDCYHSTHAEMALCSVAATLGILLPAEGFKFIAWAQEFLTIDLVLPSNLEPHRDSKTSHSDTPRPSIPRPRPQGSHSSQFKGKLGCSIGKPGS